MKPKIVYAEIAGRTMPSAASLKRTNPMTPKFTQGEWQPMESAPMDGTKILCIDAGGNIQVAYPKKFPRPFQNLDGTRETVEDMRKSKAGDRWEYFRDEINAAGHVWDIYPTHWMPLPEPPSP